MTENSKRGVVSIFLVLALVFSMVTISAPMASAGGWPGNPHPGGDTIYTIAGADFLIRHWLEWNEVENGAYTITLGWYNYGNKPEENLTFVSASAYFITGSHIGESITANAVLSSAPSGSDTAWSLVVECPATAKDPRDGEFYVDITLGAYGLGGVPHIPGYHELPWMLGGVIVIEKAPLSWNRENIAISITGVGVTVDITPDSQSGWTNDVLDYTVTVTNTGQVADNYNIIPSDTLSWTLLVDNAILRIPAGQSRQTTLHVTVGAGTDTITVTADGVYADNSDTCTATQLEGLNVDIWISEPKWQEDLPGSELYYEVVIKNTGTENDNYDITISETQPWGSHFSPVTVKLYPTDDVNVSDWQDPLTGDPMYAGTDTRWPPDVYLDKSYLRFALDDIPDGSNITGAKLWAYCQIYSDYPAGKTLLCYSVDDDDWTEGTMTWDTKPAYNEPALGGVVPDYYIDDYSWDVTGFVRDEFAGNKVASFMLFATDEPTYFEINSKEEAGGEPDRRPYLEVTYEPPPPPVSVTTKPATDVTKNQATLNADFTVGTYASVNVWFQYRVQGETTWIETTPTTYTADGSHSDVVTGLSYETTYEFRAALQYGETIYGDTLTFTTELGYTPPAIQPGENITLTLTVPIPGDAVPCTTNYITVTATSQCDPTVSDSDTCEAHVKAALAVDVTVEEPTWQEQHANKLINYSVTITNEGMATDNYELVLTDTLGWNPTWDIVVDKLLATDDGSFNEATPDDPPRDAGTYYNMYNGWSPKYLSQRSYLKFDLSEIPLGSVIKSATLWASGYYGPSGVSFDDYTWHLVDAMSVEDDDWSESTITWNKAAENHPVGDVLDTDNFASYYYVGYWAWCSWDVTSWVQSEFAGDKWASIALVGQNEPPDNYNSSGWFTTKDTEGHWSAGHEAHLEVVYAPGVTDTIQVTLDNGESVTLGFSVVVPADAIPSQTNVITVTATSKTDGSVTDSDTAEAHVELMRKVVAEVVGPTWQETYKDPLTYVIKIHNAGQIVDKYVLTAYDRLGWPLHVEPQEIYLKPCHEAQAALSVTIPYQTPGSTTDDITVVVEGQLASGQFSDPTNVSTSVSVQAHAKEVYGVDVEVYPSIHQTGHPNSMLTWLVTVTNTGNMPDTYDLDFSQNVYDVNRPYSPWEGDLTQHMVELGQGEEASILLNLLVTDGLRTGVHNDILVEASSEMARDEASVTAQVLEQKPLIPQGEIQLQATAGIVAIDVWPTYYDFGVFNEMDTKSTPADYFTIRNIGNVNVEVSIAGTDATSKPGEPAAKWTLGDGSVGVDMYAMWWTEVDTVTKTAKVLASPLVPSEETTFDITVQAPSTFTTPAKMWMKVLLTARKLH